MSFPAGSNTANYNTCAVWNSLDGNLTTVGSNGGTSAYGTFDQNGNVKEIVTIDHSIFDRDVVYRGGGWDSSLIELAKAERLEQPVGSDFNSLGFRLAASGTLDSGRWCSVGDINNSGDIVTGYGSVSYQYWIGKYLVTNCEYAEFLNAVAKTDRYGLYHNQMTSSPYGGIVRDGLPGAYFYYLKDDMDKKPVVFVNWYDAARYANWLHNNKPTGYQDDTTTEDGAYPLNGICGGYTVPKKAQAKYYVPDENQWYKAAYYKASGIDVGYWDYATQADVVEPVCINSDAQGNGPIFSEYQCLVVSTTTTTTSTTSAPTTTTTTTTHPPVLNNCNNKQYSSIQIRRDSEEDFNTFDPVLASGEPAFATDSFLFKIGDGVTPWTELASPSLSGSRLISPVADNLLLDTLTFNTDLDADPDLTKGQLSWNNKQGTINLGITDLTSIDIGGHTLFRLKNTTGMPLSKGQAVYASGVDSDGIILPSLYAANNEIQEIKFIGLVLEDLPHNTSGYAIQFGRIENVDTRGDGPLNGDTDLYSSTEPEWESGDILYVHPEISGKLTKIKPEHSIPVAIILQKADLFGDNGSIFVRPTNFGHIEDNHDVNLSGLLDDHLLIYDNASQQWKPSLGLTFTDSVSSNTLRITADQKQTLISQISYSDNDPDPGVRYTNRIIFLSGKGTESSPSGLNVGDVIFNIRGDAHNPHGTLSEGGAPDHRTLRIRGLVSNSGTHYSGSSFEFKTSTGGPIYYDNTMTFDHTGKLYVSGNFEASSGNFSNLTINGSGVATTDYVDNILSLNDALLFKGTLGVGGTITSLPSIYETGWVYKVTTAGTYADNVCEVGDLVIAIADRPTGGGSNADWVVAQTNIDLQSLPTIVDPCDTEYVLVQDAGRDTKVISILDLADAISTIDGGGVTYSGC